MDHRRRTTQLITGMLLLALAAGVVIGWAPFTTDQPGQPLVHDGAGLMPGDQRAAVARYHDHLLDDFDIDYRVVTARGVKDIDRAAVETFRALGETSRSRSGRALLLLIDPASDQVRLEVGYPLEGVFPDAFIDYVERRQMVPFFEAGRVADGIVATTELIVTRAQRGSEGLGTATEAWTASSGGAGASTDARLGAGRAASAGMVDVQPGRSPEETLRAYVRAMAAHNDNAELSLYTPETREMLAGRLITPAQMDNAVASYRRCEAQRTIVSSEGERAAIRYPAAARLCAPFFFRRLNGRWLLDLSSMQRAIRFDTANRWHLQARESHAYGFAFADWQFDPRGYPEI